MAGKDHNEALREAIVWAGESITTSGISVIIGFGAMSLCSFAMIKTMGIVLAAGIVFALLAALTLIPAIIAVVGDKIFYPNKAEKLDPKGKTMNSWYGSIVKFGHRYFRSSAEHATKYAVPIVLAAVLITLPLGYVAMNNSGSFDMISTMPESESKEGVEAITENAYGGLVMPTYVLLEVDNDDLLYTTSSVDVNGQTIPTWVWNTEGKKYADYSTKLSMALWDADDSLYNLLTDKPGGNIAYVIGAMDFSGMINLMANAGNLTINDYLALASMFPFEDYGEIMAVAPEDLIKRFMSPFPEAMVMPIMYYMELMSTGVLTQDQCAGAVNYAINSMGAVSKPYDEMQYIKLTAVVKDEPMSELSMDTVTAMKGIVDEKMAETNSLDIEKAYVTGTVPVLVDMSESINKDFKMIEVVVIVLIALLLFFVMKSYLTPLRSLVTIIMSVLWTLGLTFIVFEGILGVPVTFIMPIILFVICLGLGMDYDILLTTRIRENVSKGMSNDKAIKEAIVKSGSIITICGIIMAGAFGTMMLSTSPMLQEIGFALCFAIAVDALFIRTYVVPALMHLMGKWNWVGPKWLVRDGKDLPALLAEAKDDGTLDSIDEYLAYDSGYRFCTGFRAGMYGLVSVLAFAVGVFVSWIAMGKPAFDTIAFIDIVSAAGNAGTAATIAMVVSAIFMFLAGICAINCLKGTAKASGLMMGAGALAIVVAIFMSSSEAWGVAFALVGLASVALFRPVKGRGNAVLSGIAVATLVAMVAVYFNEVFFVTMLLSLVSMAALLVTSVALIVKG